MQAVIVTSPGGSEQLALTEVPDPVCGPDDVLIDVTATAVNRADLLQRAGQYPPPPGASGYLGLECSGRVATVGASVREWRVGDEVCALLTGGGYAQRVAARADQCLPIPPGVDLADAAALPEAACTVWSNVFDLGGLQALDTILIHGGAGGIGTLAIQLAAAHGARVLTTARPAKHAALHELGAEVVIDYREADFVAAVHVATANRGADVILDVMGASHLARNVEALATGGRLLVIGLQGGRSAELNLATLLTRRAQIIATTLRSRPDHEKAAIVAAVRDHVWPMFGRSLVRPVIHARLALSDAARAHQMVEAGEHIGKILLLA